MHSRMTSLQCGLLSAGNGCGKLVYFIYKNLETIRRNNVGIGLKLGRSPVPVM
jgi:hypothetical protein